MTSLHKFVKKFVRKVKFELNISAYNQDLQRVFDENVVSILDQVEDPRSQHQLRKMTIFPENNSNDVTLDCLARVPIQHHWTTAFTSHGDNNSTKLTHSWFCLGKKFDKTTDKATVSSGFWLMKLLFVEYFLGHSNMTSVGVVEDPLLYMHMHMHNIVFLIGSTVTEELAMCEPSKVFPCGLRAIPTHFSLERFCLESLEGSYSGLMMKLVPLSVVDVGATLVAFGKVGRKANPITIWTTELILKKKNNVVTATSK
ncbi:hypothetical protein DY000_02029337 [Brassica cretica]|uniref:Uncharacterized protein n=1 Tax=Brassica cretica TaxID=69181 RepID=A0ABQ7DG10_BRACR|nr:hypothetical protein DY000_02029337 [Brassica cretica]